MTQNSARDLEMLVRQFEAGGWSELRVEAPGVSVLLSRDTAAPSIGSAATASVPADASQPTAPVPTVRLPAAPMEASSRAGAGTIDPSWHVVAAPNLGTFYRSPKPGAPPFVEIGQHVSAQTEVCLIEVMKLFTSVRAGVTGIVRHIAAADAELVEGGQSLLFIEQNQV